jgi:uncharacterized protein (TIGR03000 family)
MLQKLIRPAGALLLVATLVFLTLAFPNAAPRGGGDHGGNNDGYSPSYLHRTVYPPYSYYPRNYYPYYYGYPYSSRAYPSRYYTPGFGYSSGYYSDSRAGLESLPFPSSVGPSGTAPSLGSATTSVHADAPATITLIAPASADVWFDEWKVPARTSELTTPALKPGRKYTYQVRAAWWGHGRTVIETRDLTVTAGEHVRITFPSPKAGPAKHGR